MRFAAYSKLALTTVALTASMTVPTTPTRAQVTVFDPTNYAQNLLVAARSLQQVNQQIRQLQNEAQLLAGMRRNLSRLDFPRLDALKQKMLEIDRLMTRAQALDFRTDRLDESYRELFPQAFAASRQDVRVRNARARLDASVGALRQTMAVQSQVVENVRSDAQALSEITARSQGAEGSLQVTQATNQLLALTTKQQFQLQQMIAAQYRSEAVEHARQATQAAEARAATKQFLGSGSAYTPD